MSTNWRSVAAGMVSLAICLWLPATGAVAGDWEWSIAPYIWATDLGLDVTVKDEPVIGADASFSDLLDKTDIAGMVHFEGSSGKAGFYLDLYYVELSDERTTSADPPLPGGTLTDSELDTGIYEAVGFYRVLTEGQFLDVFLGARVIDMDQQTRITLPSTAMTTVGTSESFLDGLVGLRYGRPIGNRWDFIVRGDVSTGDSELSWNSVATFGVRLGKTDKYGVRFGWRHLDIEVESTSGGVKVESDLTLSGPAAAFRFTF